MPFKYSKGKRMVDTSGKVIVPGLNQKEKKQTRQIVKKTIANMAEWKGLEKNVTMTSSYSGDIQDWSAVPQGDGDDDRDGDSIRAYSISLRGQCFNSDANNVYRVIFFQWLSDSSPVASDILSTTGSSYAPLSPYVNSNVGKKKLCLILYDRTFKMDENYSGGITNVLFQKKIKLRRKKIVYQASSTTGVGKVYSLTISDSLTGNPTMYLCARLHYLDF